MPIQKESIPIMKTKLYRPPVTDDFVFRKSLFNHLKKETGLPLTLVIAPAGYGKSTLISHWLEHNDSSSAWISLEETDNDLRTFLTYFIAAIQTACPMACKKMAARLRSRDLPAPQTLAEELHFALCEMDQPVQLVLDDYHEIRTHSIHDLLSFQLKHPAPNLHLILLSRRDPPLPIASLRAHNRLCEIRLADLMFSFEETQLFVQQAAPCDLSEKTIRVLHEVLEGWPVGLRLLIATLGEEPDEQRLAEGISGTSAHIQDYLAAEVLSKLSPVRQKCISRISVLDRFCAPLCHALCRSECGNSPCMYDEHQEGLSSDVWTPLCISLDAKNHWFRFHHVFQKVLRQNMKESLSSNEIKTLHRRAMGWLESNGSIQEALHHARQISQEEAADLVVRHRHHAMNEEQWISLRLWLSELPPSIVEKTPDLVLLQAWISVGYPEMSDHLDQAQKLLKGRKKDADTSQLQGEFLAYTSLGHYAVSDAKKAAQAATEALTLLDPEQLSERGFAHIILTVGKQMLGDLSGAQESVFAALKDQSGLHSTYHARLWNALCFIYWIDANPRRLFHVAVEFQNLGQQLGFSETLDHSHYFLGLYHYAHNELDASATHLEKVTRNPEISNMHNYLHSVYAHALSLQAQGEETAAHQLAQDAISQSLQRCNPTMIQQSQAFEAELALRQGRVSEAKQWADQFNPEETPLVMWRFYVPHFTQIRIDLATDGDRPLEDVIRRITDLCDLTEKNHNRHFQLTALILKALALEKNGQTAAALVAMDHALQIAQPGGSLRAFIDEGPRVATLLNQMELNDEALHFAGRILAELKKMAQPNRVGSARKLINPLSNREREVLALMAQGFLNKEIGGQLFISPGTVKRHTNSIYGKLSVHTRREAVVKADGLGLLND